MRLLKKCKTLRAALGGRLARMGRRGRWELSVLLGLALALSLSSFTRFSAACAGVREDTLRLHILANSDSEADQELKLAVRDAILQAEGGMFAAERTKEGALRAAGADLEAIRAVAQRTVRARAEQPRNGGGRLRGGRAGGTGRRSTRGGGRGGTGRAAGGQKRERLPRRDGAFRRADGHNGRSHTGASCTYSGLKRSAI